jgi:hypothetical protein
MPKDLVLLGSLTAKSGFQLERDIVKKFNNWKDDKEAQTWIIIFGYNVNNIESVSSERISGSHKTDVQIKIVSKNKTYSENISVKLVTNPQGFNQIDKRWVDKYKDLWNIPPDIANTLKLFTGQIKPTRLDVRDPRRMFFDEMDSDSQNKLLDFFTNSKKAILEEIIKGTDEFPANWMLVVLRLENEKPVSVLKSIDEAITILGCGDVCFSPKGSLKIGKVTMQRKGGNRGRETAKMLQFKINPADLFGK